MTLNTVSGIATHIVTIFDNVSAGVSGTMTETVEMSKQHVSNFTGAVIDSSSIDPKYQPAIVCFAKADTIDLEGVNGGDAVKLDDFSISSTGDVMTAQQYKLMGEKKLNALGRQVNFSRSLS